jgi:hypothetical protein
MSVALDAGKKLPPALLNRIRKRAGVDRIGLEERLLLEAENLPFHFPVEYPSFSPPKFSSLIFPTFLSRT